MDWDDEDPGTCAYCGSPHEHVRPGKTQPTCECDMLCRQHEPPERMEYRDEKHLTNVASKARGEGMLLGYVCPKCFHD